MDHNITRTLNILKLASTGVDHVTMSDGFFARLSALKTLGLSYNPLELMPNISALSDTLTTLSLTQTNIKSLAIEDIGTFENLLTLDIAGNEFEHWQNISGVFALNRTLTTLNLANNVLHGDAGDIWAMSALKSLDLSNSLIGCLPAVSIIHYISTD